MHRGEDCKKGGRIGVMVELEKEGWISHEVDKIEGDLIYIKGAQFPFRGVPTQEAVIAANIIKKLLKLPLQGLIEALEFVLKYDWAYRIRFLDLCEELNPNNGPWKEIGRLIEINKARDDKRVHTKIALFARILRCGALFPSFRAQYHKWVKIRPRMDDIERYWGYQKLDYDLEGKNFYQRMGEMQKRGWKLPPNNLM